MRRALYTPAIGILNVANIGTLKDGEQHDVRSLIAEPSSIRQRDGRR